jgi:hypothetical protein
LLGRSLLAADAIAKHDHSTLLPGQGVEQLVEARAGEAAVHAFVRLACPHVDDLGREVAVVGARTVHRNEARRNA